MTVKQINDSVSSATYVTVYVAKTKQDALNGNCTTCYNSSGLNGIPERVLDYEVDFIYPIKKDYLEVWVVKDTALDDALSKLGSLAIEYLTNRNKAMANATHVGRDSLSQLNAGRIEGFLRCVKQLAICTDEELNELENHFYDNFIEDEETQVGYVTESDVENE